MTANIDQLVQNVVDARAAQEATVERLRGTGQGEFDSRNQQMLDSIRQVRTAESELQQALPEGTNIDQYLGGAKIQGQQSPGGSDVAPTAADGGPAAQVSSAGNGGNRFLQNVLDAHRLGNIQFNLQDNMLNQYDRYTYHFAMHMVSDTDSEKITLHRDIFTPGAIEKITIAESGVTTGFNIVRIEIQDFVSPGFRTRNTLTTELSITLTEPYGMTIVDRMFQASKQLQIKSWRFAPIVLTLEIRGYSDNGTPISSSPIKKAWKILILDFDSTLNESGSVYTITATASNSLAFRDQFYMLPTNVVIQVNEGGKPTSITVTNTPPPQQPPPAAERPVNPPATPNTSPPAAGSAPQPNPDTPRQPATPPAQNPAPIASDATPGSNSQAGTVPPSTGAPQQPAGTPAPAPTPAQSSPTAVQPPATAGAQNQATGQGQDRANAPSSPPPGTPMDGSVGQFFSKLGQIMTDFYRKARADPTATGGVPYLIYEFRVAPDLASQQIEITATANARRRTFNINTNGREIHINRVGISELVDDIVASLADKNWFNTTAAHGRVKVPRVESRIEHIGWDGILNDYVRRITFYVSVMETLRAIPNQEYGDRFQNNPTNQLTRLNAIAEQGLHKLYPYIFSGYNTEIIKFDIKFNHLHIIPMPLFQGQTNTPASEGQSEIVRLGQERTELQARQTSLAAEERTITQSIDTLRSGRQSVTPAQAPQGAVVGQTPGTVPDATAPASNQIAVLEDNLARVRTAQQVNNLTLAQIGDNTEEIRNRGVQIFDANTARMLNLPAASAATIARQQAQTQQQLQAARQPRKFLEDINVNSNNPIRISYASDPRDINNNLNRSPTTTDPRQNESRNIYSTMLGQLYDRVGYQLTEVELEIRGDPYWLGLTNMERVAELSAAVQTVAGSQNAPAGQTNAAPGNQPTAASANTSAPQTAITQTYASGLTGMRDRTYANYYGRDAQFLLLFRAGNQPSDTTGFMDFNRNSTQNQSVFFNGVYNALQVTHVFESGKFTQRLMGVRDPLINLNDIRGAQSGQTAAGQGATGPAGSSAGPANPTQPNQAAAPAATPPSAANPGSDYMQPLPLATSTPNPAPVSPPIEGGNPPSLTPGQQLRGVPATTP